nr:glycoside hydrolase family 9 protein [Butyrivibrio sp.]
MNNIFLNQVGFVPKGTKRAVLNFDQKEFEIRDLTGKCVFTGKVKHFGTDDISGENTFIADFSELKEDGSYRVYAKDVSSAAFTVSENVYDKLMRDICKCFYYLRCGDVLTKEYAGEYYHEPCHMTKATVYGEDVPAVDVSGGWHDAGDYGRYSTAGAVAVAHILYGVRFFPKLLKTEFDIPKEKCQKGNLPDILSEVKVELDFLMKMQREDGSVWHKVTTFNHAPFVMPQEDKNELFLFPVSSMATADVAAVFALASSIYKDYDSKYADKLMLRAKKACEWLEDNPGPLLFKNAEGSNTGEYGENEDISNRFWAAASMYEVTGDKTFYEELLQLEDRLCIFDEEDKQKGYQGDVFTCFGWAQVAGLGCLSLILKGDGDELSVSVQNRFVKEADRLVASAKKNGFNLCMEE